MVSKQHKARVINELRKAGATKYALFRSETKHLPELIHENEHIGGIVYGRIDTEFSILIATDKRVLFVQRMALFNTTDELTYDVVAGVKLNNVGIFSSVTLHTRVHDYDIRYANKKCAAKFVNYIEQRRLENSSTSNESPANSTLRNILSSQAMDFIKEHDLGVLSTISRTGQVNGSVVYYIVDKEDFIYILTRQETGKARAIIANGQISLTVHEPGTLKVAQAQGTAEIEQDNKVKTWVFDNIVQPRSFRGSVHMPPVTKLESKGGYVVFKITPTYIEYNDYSK